MESTAQLTREWLNSNPAVVECFERDIINLSKLARTILVNFEDKTDKHTFEGVLAALKRFRGIDKYKLLDKRIREVCRQSTYQIKTKRHIYILESNTVLNSDDLADAKHLVQGEGSFTAVFDHPRNLSGIHHHFEAVEIIISQPEEVELIPGVSNFILSIFRVRGINILEFFSSYNETIAMIAKKDLIKGVEALDQIIG